MIRSYEFWHPRLFEAPYYLYLLWLCLWNRLPPKFLAKANYALDHGEIGIGSKLQTQLAFAQDRFLPSRLLEANLPIAQRVAILVSFANVHGYPVVVKPDIGAVGKGVIRINSAHDVEAALSALTGVNILQRYAPDPCEYGVFVVRQQQHCRITGINKKHFPTVEGDGVHTVGQLAQDHDRYTEHWRLFLRYHDLNEVLLAGEKKRLSFIGSHTMGCKFTDDSHLCTPQLQAAIDEVCESQSGFNFGRFDVKCTSEAAFQQGQFVVIEVNGVASLPTHMFDPDKSIVDAYRIFFRHARLLVQVAIENRHQPMALKSWSKIWQQVKGNAGQLNRMHKNAMRTP